MTAYTPSLQLNPGFLNTLQLIKPHNLEESVQLVWQEIVTEWFPGRHGYKWDFKGSTLAKNNVPDVTVAIGKKVKFYQFDGKALRNQNVVQLHQGTFDMDTANGITQVENMMNYIKANAWQWASS